MHDPWTHLKDVLERAMGNLERKESASARSNMKGAEHTAETIGRKAEGEERRRAGVIFTAVRKAGHLIDMERQLAVLREAHDQVFPSTATAASPSASAIADSDSPAPASANASASTPSAPPPPTSL